MKLEIKIIVLLSVQSCQLFFPNDLLKFFLLSVVLAQIQLERRGRDEGKWTNHRVLWHCKNREMTVFRVVIPTQVQPLEEPLCHPW